MDCRARYLYFSPQLLIIKYVRKRKYYNTLSIWIHTYIPIKLSTYGALLERRPMQREEYGSLRHTHLFNFFQKYFWDPDFGHFFCPFFKILETFIKWKRKQGIWKNMAFLHDGHKINWLQFICEHTFFWWFPNNPPLFQYFPFLEAYFRQFVRIGVI